MRRIYYRATTILIFIVSFSHSDAQLKSSKRGVAYSFMSEADIGALSPGISWWYNWHHSPDVAVMNTFEKYDADFVPMAWNGSFNKQALRNFLSAHPGIKYILGWNEPNFRSQANMTPSQAAALWPEIESIADEFGLAIVGPAVNYCGDCVTENGTTYTDPVKYLDDFFTLCHGCRVDHIAVHCYMGNASALQWYVGLFKKYGKPIWVTEFASWENNPTQDQQKNFLIDAVDYLENDTSIFRYAWFTGKYSGAPYIGLLEYYQNGRLTDLGKAYVNMPVHDTGYFATLPAHLEAENYNRMQGVSVEATTDNTGYFEIGSIEINDWLEYGIEVPETDTFSLQLRISSAVSSGIQLLVDGALVKTVSIPAAGWRTVTEAIPLPEGKHTLTLKASPGGFNINWINITSDVVQGVGEHTSDEVVLFPNPAGDRIWISRPFKKASIISISGQQYHTGIEDNMIDVSYLPRGVYVLKLFVEDSNFLLRKFAKK